MKSYRSTLLVFAAAGLLLSPSVISISLRDDPPFDPLEGLTGGAFGPLLGPLGALTPSLKPLALNVTALAALMARGLGPLPASPFKPTFPHPQPGPGGVCAQGSSMRAGKTTDRSGLSWQSSGALSEGCPEGVAVRTCYTLELSGDPSSDLDPGGGTPRQRIEFLTQRYYDGETAFFTWKSFVHDSVQTSGHFFHLFQLFTRSADGPVLTLDLKNGLSSVLDPLRCPGGCGAGTWIGAGPFKGRTLVHAMQVRFGPGGRVDYVFGDASTRRVEAGYSASGGVGRGETYLKFGTYRAAVYGMGPSLAYYGDFRSER